MPFQTRSYLHGILPYSCPICLSCTPAPSTIAVHNQFDVLRDASPLPLFPTQTCPQFPAPSSRSVVSTKIIETLFKSELHRASTVPMHQLEQVYPTSAPIGSPLPLQQIPAEQTSKCPLPSSSRGRHKRTNPIVIRHQNH